MEQVVRFTFPRNPCVDLQYGSERPTTRALGAGPMAVALWAFLFVLFILGGAAAGVIGIGLGVVHQSLTDWEAAALGLVIVFFALVEGYMGFHASWSPATARRCYLAGYAASGPCSLASASVIAFAPLFAAGYFFAPLRRLCVSYFLVAFIVGLVVAVKQCPSPWHEIIDCGVAVGLVLGTLSFAFHFLRCLCSSSRSLPEDVDFKPAKAPVGSASDTSSSLQNPLLLDSP